MGNSSVTPYEQGLKETKAKNEEEVDIPKIICKNWNEICYINNYFDIRDVTYEIKAAGLSDFMNFNSFNFSFDPSTIIEILLFEIDGEKQINYQIKDNCLIFKINLKNLETNKIHIKYKEFPKQIQMPEEEKVFKDLIQTKYYSLSENLIGQKAKYILINQSDFEIINLDNEIFIKKNDNEYYWEGIVPEEDRKTKVCLSKKEGLVNFYEKQGIKTTDNSLIKNSDLKIPFSYINGNNETIKLEYHSKPTAEINIDKNNKIYDIKFQNINSDKAEFILEGEFKNKCKGDWVVNLTNEEIDSLIPNDFKENKEFFKKIANDIINEYDKKHQNDLIKVPDIVKIGKWVHKNIMYDIRYYGLNQITATETFKNKRGVNDHITKLFNALIYSLGYQVLYAFGFALSVKNTFEYSDCHCWSLININKNGQRWLPFDATWGIFSGKLPITHIFMKFGTNGAKLITGDKADLEQTYIKGSIK